jgi:hypothetical protein
MAMATACFFGLLLRFRLFPAAAALIGLLLLTAMPSRAAEPGFDIATQKLFAAVHANDLQAAQASVAAGADLNAKDRWGMSAIELAIDKGYFSIAHFLTSTRNLRRYATSPAPVDRVNRARQTQPGVSAAPAAASSPPPPEVPKSRPGAGASAASAAPAGAAEAPARAAERNNPFDPRRPAPGATLPVVGAGAPPPPEAPAVAPVEPVAEPAAAAAEGNWADANSPGFALTDTLEPPIGRPTPRPAPSSR